MPRVLVVDDSCNEALLKEKLAGFEVTSVADSIDALSRLEIQIFDAVIIGKRIGMDSDRFELALEIIFRYLSRYSHYPLIFIKTNAFGLVQILPPVGGWRYNINDKGLLDLIKQS